jgi:hypothetical protein
MTSDIFDIEQNIEFNQVGMEKLLKMNERHRIMIAKCGEKHIDQ